MWPREPSEHESDHGEADEGDDGSSMTLEVAGEAAVPKTAWYAIVAEPEGNIFAIWQADTTATPSPEPEE